ncbi:MAG: S8 family serine peptidase [Burkholderiales bacterium]|nr:S8 family serine peptidase [Burkholderiales bacterium]
MNAPLRMPFDLSDAAGTLDFSAFAPYPEPQPLPEDAPDGTGPVEGPREAVTLAAAEAPPPPAAAEASPVPGPVEPAAVRFPVAGNTLAEMTFAPTALRPEAVLKGLNAPGAAAAPVAPGPSAPSASFEAPPSLAGSAIAVRGVGVTNDPLANAQWYKAHMDVLRLGSDFTGRGVKVGIYDDGIDKAHVDLRGNYNAALELTINGIRLDPSQGGTHGTSVSGIVAASADNGVGVSGIAYGAQFAVVNIFGNAGGSNMLTAMRLQTTYDVTNHSWGWVGRYVDSTANAMSFGGQFSAALTYAGTWGRGGLGTIEVNSAGNDSATNANASSFNASRYTITVGAIADNGDVSFYSTRGSSVLLSASSNGGWQGITTTDRTGAAGYSSTDFTSGFGGTSAAAPMVTAAVARMLSANAGLGWRDVQDILAISADHTTPAGLNGTLAGNMQNGWLINKADNVNGGGLHYSNDVGFGRLDAFEAVRFAEVWRNFGPAQTTANEQVATVSGATSLALRDLTTASTRFTVSRAVEMESVALTLTLSHGNVNDLRVELVSPEGTRTVVLTPMSGTQSVAGWQWTFTSEALRGELSAGTWTLNITDTRANGLQGTLTGWKLDVYGDAPALNDVMHITDEFEKMAVLDASRRTLRDLDGGTDWINMASQTEAVNVNLSPGVATTVGGRNFFTIAAGSTFENVVTGDGNDVLTGNAAANRLLGMRGDDVLQGLGGADTIDGGLGIDTARYATSAAGVVVNLATNINVGGDAQGDVLVSVENIVGSSLNDVITGDAGANGLDGGAGNDRILGGAGADVMLGGLGNDTLVGGAGNDHLLGGLGTDIYAFDFSGFGRDVVSGFEWGLDRLDLRGASTSAQVSWSTVGTDLVVAIAGSLDAIVLEGHGGRQLAARDFIWG